jgi:transcriptional regulator with XRE-family HTH domain
VGYSKARLDKFDDFEEIRRNRLTSKEMKLQDAEVALEVAALQSMQECISTELARYMAEEGIGINELTRRLNTSSRQTSRIMKGEANITLATLAEVAGVIGVKARIVFER